MIDQRDLEFDHENPRLIGYGIQKATSEREIIELLWNEMSVDEVAMSIASNGFFPHEPIIVAKEQGKWVVIEGNRRLAAVRTLSDVKLHAEFASDIKLAKGVLEQISTLPVIVSTRKDSWQYLGFRHVNGPARWGSFAKASYIAQVHNEYDIPLSKIASQIGDKHRTVQRLYRALMVLNQARKERVYNIEDRSKSHLSFSHLYTGLDYEGFQEYLALSSEESETKEPVPKSHFTNLKEVLIWLFGSKKNNVEPLIRSQNPDLRNLDRVLKSKEARHALRQGTSLSDAVILAAPAPHRLEESLLEAKKQVSSARGLVSEAYKGEEELLRLAGTVANLSDDLYKEMESKASKRKPARLTEQAN